MPLHRVLPPTCSPLTLAADVHSFFLYLFSQLFTFLLSATSAIDPRFDLASKGRMDAAEDR